MKRYTTTELVNILVNRGHSVITKPRKDGGNRIVAIDGQRFSGSSGNKKAREMTGKRLSKAQYEQRRTNARKRRVKKLPKTLTSQLRKTRVAMRKTDVKTRITMKNIRIAYKRMGAKALTIKLKAQERYARGYAYIENVEWFISRLEQFGAFSNHSYGDIIINLRRKIDKIKDETLMHMYDQLYNAEHMSISANELENKLWSIIESEII